MVFFILVGNPSICRFQLQKTPHKVIVTNLFQLDPDQHFKSSWIRIGIEKNIWIRISKNCGSTVLLLIEGWIRLKIIRETS